MQERGPWIINFPSDVQVVGAYFDAERGGTFFIIRSQQHPRIARGARIPEGVANFYGLKYLYIG